MGRRKPTAELASLEHNKGRYADRAEEPQAPPVEDEAPPAWLNETAKKHWPDFLAITKEMRVLLSSDKIALAMLAEAFAEWREAVDRVNGKKGIKLPRELTSLDKAHRRLLEMQIQFGMTPLARTRIRATPKPAKENKFGQLAGKRRAGTTKSQRDEEDDER